MVIPFFSIPLFVRNQIGVWTLMVTGFLGIMIILVRALTNYYTYRHQFKEMVVKELVGLINPNFKYNPNDHINVFEFNHKAKALSR